MKNKPHFCPDWDEMYLYPGMPEMENCLCDPDGPEVQPGAKLKTGFVRGEEEVVRTVESVYQFKNPPLKSQTGWWVKVEGLGQLDAGWFREL